MPPKAKQNWTMTRGYSAPKKQATKQTKSAPAPRKAPKRKAA